jgi:hypothetical protein
MSFGEIEGWWRRLKTEKSGTPKGGQHYLSELLAFFMLWK